MKTTKEEYTNEAWRITDEKTDYLNYVTRSSTKKQRRKFRIGDIFINAAVCLHCKDYIRSTHKHDYVTCSCGKVSVDGGSWYVRRRGQEEDMINIVEPFYDSSN